jgi:pilus assembly protein CpaC
MVFLRGTVKDLNGSARAVQIASTGGKVVNLLNVMVPAADPQILLKVRFASVDRSKEKQLGINVFSSGLGNTIARHHHWEYSPPTVGLPSGGSPASASIGNELNLFAFFPGLNIGATIEALEQRGLVEVLAEPNVMAVNGKEASFLAGGEYPYPMAQASAGGQPRHQHHVQGIWRSPQLHPHHHASRNHSPPGGSRSQRSSTSPNAIEISGFDVPAITTRKVKTEVELSDGQSFVIGGC